MPRSANVDRQALSALLTKQSGVITRGQAQACGLSQHAVTYRIRRGGPWQVLAPGIYLTHLGPPEQRQREMAALLYGGPHSVLTGYAALRRHGLPTALRHYGPAVNGTGALDVLVPAQTQRRDAGFICLHRTSRLPERICVDGDIRFALAERAVADAVRDIALPEARTVVAEALQRGRCSLPHLAGELAAGPVRGSAGLRLALAEVRKGIRSTAEADLHDLIVWAELPEPAYNPRLFVSGAFLAMPDCWWPGAGVAAEVDSREWHFSPRDWENTLARHARMSAHGIVVLHFTPRQIRAGRAEVAATIRRAISAGRPLPHVEWRPAT